MLKKGRSSYVTLLPRPNKDKEGDIIIGGVNKIKEGSIKKLQDCSKNCKYFICKSPNYLMANCLYKAAIKHMHITVTKDL
jgi:hypothetical protein